MALIRRDLLPSCIWQDNVLHLPEDVNSVYEAKLTQLGLYDQALQQGGFGRVYGGPTREQTHQHFARMYPNSISRVQGVILDPHDAFSQIPRDLLVTLSSHRISILDIPCGAGAATISALTTLKELRVARMMSTTPLSVSILGADISEHALELYRDQLNQIIPGLAKVGISASLETRRWDATNVQETNDMIDDLLANSPSK